MTLTKTREKLLKEFEEKFPLGGEIWVLERHKEEVAEWLTQALKDYSEAVIRMVEGMRKDPKVKSRICDQCDKYITTNYCPDCGETYSEITEHHYEDMITNQALNDIKEELQK